MEEKKKTMGFRGLLAAAVVLCLSSLAVSTEEAKRKQLRFRENGEFKIVQVADMHYGDGKTTPCREVLPSEMASCSDLNTTAFIRRMILAEKPDLVVFTGDNICSSATDAARSLEYAFSPAITSSTPWAAVLGNHDQESSLSREEVMKHTASLNHTLSQVNPTGVDVIDGFGNYNLEVHGVEGSGFENKSVLNLYFLDSGDYSTVPSISGYGWIKPSQKLWFQQTSLKLQKAYMSKPESQEAPAPGLAYFHIPLPEYASVDSSNYTGVNQDGISSPSVNSGFFTTMVEAGDVKAVFTGHDHLNDFCGEYTGIQLCYSGGFGYHAYGKVGWARRSRVVVATLEKTGKASWGPLMSIKTWKRLDDEYLTAIDAQVLWGNSTTGWPFLENSRLFHQINANHLISESSSPDSRLSRPHVGSKSSSNRYDVNVVSIVYWSGSRVGISNRTGGKEDIIAAGSETTSTMTELLKNEVRRVLKGKDRIRESDIEELNYLKGIIKETLRMHPSGPLFPQAPREGCNVSGYDIPMNSRLIIHAYAIGRDPKYWENPEKFKPERFIESSVDYKGMHYQYLPLGSGRQICPGIAFATANLELILASMLYHYEWRLANGQALERLDMTEILGATVGRKDDLYVIASPCSLISA